MPRIFRASFPLMVFAVSVMWTEEVRAEHVIFEESFEASLPGVLTGQNYWSGTSSGEVVAFGDGQSLGRRPFSTGSAINDRYVWVDTGANASAEFSMDVRKSANTTAIFALGGFVDQSSSSRGMVLGLSGSQLIFWEGISAGNSTVITDETGAPIQTDVDTWYRIRAEIDVSGNRISALHLENLTSGGLPKQVYFGAGQAGRTVATPVNAWNLARLRVPATTGAANAWVDNFRLTVSEAPAEPLFDWSQAAALHEGILHARLEVTIPRKMVINALRVDLRHPNIRLAHNPRASNWIQDQSEAPILTTRRFVETQRQLGVNMVVATNAGAYSHNASNPEGREVNVNGLAMDRGNLVSLPQTNYPSLIYDRAWEARISQVPLDFDVSNTLTAASGFGFALRNGAPFGSLTTPDPQTLFGLSEDGRYLVMLTIDGRQTGYSEGATPREAGNFLRYFGSFEGLRMDGGGSTTIVSYNPSSQNVDLLNRPSDRFLTFVQERRNASNLGVYYINEPEQIGYEAWLLQRGVPAGKRAPLDTSNPQGVVNLLAYALNIHPTRGLAKDDPHAMPRLDGPDGDGLASFVFRKNRHATGLRWVVEQSSSLSPSSWTAAADEQIESLGVDPLTGDTLYRLPFETGLQDRIFLRLFCEQIIQ